MYLTCILISACEGSLVPLDAVHNSDKSENPECEDDVQDLPTAVPPNYQMKIRILIIP